VADIDDRMNDLNREVGEVKTEVRSGFEHLAERLDARAQIADQRFDKLESRIGDVEQATSRFTRRFVLTTFGVFGSGGTAAAAWLAKIWPHQTGPPA
jgi:predicted phage gp36 major capsid-like protein